ncbi:hypothetical protein D3C72_2429120 [compost metagenome]
MAMFTGRPKLGLGTGPAAVLMVGLPPAAQLMPTRISETPITSTTVPVTTGGNQRTILPT